MRQATLRHQGPQKIAALMLSTMSRTERCQLGRSGGTHLRYSHLRSSFFLPRLVDAQRGAAPGQQAALEAGQGAGDGADGRPVQQLSVLPPLPIWYIRM